MSSSTITLDAEKWNGLAIINMFIDTKLRDLMMLLVQSGQLDIIGTTTLMMTKTMKKNHFFISELREALPS